MSRGIRAERREVLSRRSAADGIPEPEDAMWLLAVAMLESIAEDLALTLRAGWWVVHPVEMRGRCAEGDALLDEIEEGSLARLTGEVMRGTGGRVVYDFGRLMRRARQMAGRCEGPRLGFLATQNRLRMPRLRHDRQKLEGMPPAMIDGRTNAAYQSARQKWLAARRKCRDCTGDLAEGDVSRCRSCRLYHSQRQRKYLTQPRGVPPAGAMRFVDWVKSKAAALGVSMQAVRQRLNRGTLPRPELITVTARRKWVLMGSEVAA